MVGEVDFQERALEIEGIQHYRFVIFLLNKPIKLLETNLNAYKKAVQFDLLYSMRYSVVKNTEIEVESIAWPG